MLKIEGIIPALYTSFTRKDALNLDSFRALIEYQIGGGVQGIWLAGGSGEGLLLSLDERKRLVEAAVEYADGRVLVFNHVGALTTKDAIDLAKYSEEVGVDAISAIPPFFYKPRPQEIILHYQNLAEATDLPLMAYHVPGLTNVMIDFDILTRLADIPNFVGLKYSDYNLHKLSRFLELKGGRLIVLEGNDEVLLPALLMGAHGGVGMSYSIMPEAYERMYIAYKEGNYEKAKNYQHRINHFIEILDRYSLAGYKLTMKWLGIDCGEPRLPLRRLSLTETEKLKGELEEAGFFDNLLNFEE